MIKRELLSSALFMSALGVIGCGSSGELHNGTLGSIAVQIVDKVSGDPAAGVAVWIPGDGQSGMPIQDPRGPQCNSSESTVFSGGCTDDNGIVVLFCNRNQDNEVHALPEGGTEVKANSLCTGKGKSDPDEKRKVVVPT